MMKQRLLALATGLIVALATAPPACGSTADAGDDQRNALDSFEQACNAAAPDTPLGQLCQRIRVALEGFQGDALANRRRQLADELDPQAIAMAYASMVGISRTQHNNLKNRLHQLHLDQADRGAGDMTGLALHDQRLAAGPLQSALATGLGGDGASRLLGEHWGLFLNGSVNAGDQQQTPPDVPAFGFVFYGLTGGIDYRFAHGAVVGAALGYTRFDGDVDDSADQAQSDAWTLQGFATFDVLAHGYLDLTVGHTRNDYQQSRVIDLSGIGDLGTQRPRGDTTIWQSTASLAIGYRAYAGHGWTLTPHANAYYTDTTLDWFADRGGPLAVRYGKRGGHDSFHYLLTALGLRATRAINLEHGVLLPFADLAMRHQAGTGIIPIHPIYVATATPAATVELPAPDRSTATLAAGAVYVLPSGNQMFVKLRTLLGHQSKRVHSIYFGGRFEF